MNFKFFTFFNYYVLKLLPRFRPTKFFRFVAETSGSLNLLIQKQIIDFLQKNILIFEMLTMACSHTDYWYLTPLIKFLNHYMHD